MRLITLLIFVITLNGYSQSFTDKSLTISRVSSPPKIDGKIDSKIWGNVVSNEHFVCEKPNNGKAERLGFETSFKSVYDDQAIYFLIIMNDASPDSILSQLSQRDRLDDANTDKIEIRINPFNDGQLDYSFSVSSADVQQDVKFSSNGKEEKNWNMVWESATSTNRDGWIAEIKIPYSALRFPKMKTQDWSLNIRRTIRRFREAYTWNYIDISKENTIDQAGKIIGLKNINPPIRLTLRPQFPKRIELNAFYLSFQQ